MPIRLSQIQSTKDSKWGVMGTFIHCFWECKTVWSLRDMICQFLRKLNIFFHTIQQSCSLVLTQVNRKLLSTQKPMHGCLQQLDLLMSKLRCHQEVLPKVSGSRHGSIRTVEYYSVLKNK